MGFRTIEELCEELNEKRVSALAGGGEKAIAIHTEHGTTCLKTVERDAKRRCEHTPRRNATAEVLRPDDAQKASLSLSSDRSERLTNSSRSSERSMSFFSVSLLPNRSRVIATLGRTRSFP